jgi:hypothetical protein
VELKVVCAVCGLLQQQQPANRTENSGTWYIVRKHTALTSTLKAILSATYYIDCGKTILCEEYLNALLILQTASYTAIGINILTSQQVQLMNTFKSKDGGDESVRFKGKAGTVHSVTEHEGPEGE